MRVNICCGETWANRIAGPHECLPDSQLSSPPPSFIANTTVKIVALGADAAAFDTNLSMLQLLVHK